MKKGHSGGGSDLHWLEGALQSVAVVSIAVRLVNLMKIP